MNKELHEYRKSYEKGKLLEDKVTSDPISQFKIWFKEVEDAGGVAEPNAMTVTTLGEDGFPKGRIVLLKEYDEEGFVFYSNYTSEKAKGIENHSKVGISFFWPNLERQVIIKGVVEKAPKEQSERYFKSRPKSSQIGAIVSNQSAIIKDRSVLEDRMKMLEEKYKNQEVPLPDFWGGYIVKPHSMEFWQGRPSRLHDRLLYTKEGPKWTIDRLAP